MSRLSEMLRQRNRKIIEGLSANERLALAFELGETDLEAYRSSHGISRAEALDHHRRQRQLGRRPSRCLLDSNS